MESLKKLIDILALMRGPEQGDAWSRKQNWSTLAPQTLEEIYELIEAIEQQEPTHLKQELADILYHLLFYCQLAQENNWFNINDVAQEMLDKLEQRMPPVGLRKQLNAEEINDYWQKQKQKSPSQQSLLSSVNKHLPATIYGQKLQDKAATVGFDWNDINQVMSKLTEETAELQHEIISNQSHDKIVEELGDVFFVCVNLARHLKVSAEVVLRKANDKFLTRFNYIEKQAKIAGKDLKDMSLPEMEALWQQAKHLTAGEAS